MNVKLSAFLTSVAIFFSTIVAFFSFGEKNAEAPYVYDLSSFPVYENTMETAIPQTQIYSFVKAHLLKRDGGEKKVAIIGYDGARADCIDAALSQQGGISYLLDDGGKAYITYCGGQNYPQVLTQKTKTAAGWCSVLTGKWATETGVYGNNIIKLSKINTILTEGCEEGFIDDGASFFTSWRGHFEKGTSTYKLEKRYCEKNDLDVNFCCKQDDEEVLSEIIAEIEKPVCDDVIFCIFEDTDHTGHNTGFTPENPDYMDAFKNVDSYAMDIINAIEYRENYLNEDWLIIITTDHGGYEFEHGGDTIQERMTFLVTNKDFGAAE